MIKIGDRVKHIGTKEATMNCAYQLSDDTLCPGAIIPDAASYSGYSHTHVADWCHWATPISGRQDPALIFKPCIACGKLGPENEAHIRFDGHKFDAGPSAGSLVGKVED